MLRQQAEQTDNVVPVEAPVLRQYYGPWHKQSRPGSFYRVYYYKPERAYAGFKHHYVLYSVRKPNEYYFYDPYTKRTWGRCQVDSKGQPLFSILAEKDRKELLEDIPETAFPAPGKLPPVPESVDDATLELPPDDLPTSMPKPN